MTIITVVPVYISPEASRIPLPGEPLALKDGDPLDYACGPFSRHLKHLATIKDVFEGNASISGIVWTAQPRQLMAQRNVALIAVMLKGNVALNLKNIQDDYFGKAEHNFNEHLYPGASVYLKHNQTNLFLGTVTSFPTVYVHWPVFSLL